MTCRHFPVCAFCCRNSNFSQISIIIHKQNEQKCHKLLIGFLL
ncbi:hypothetical protein [Klebsiella aerogenes EA1509E]|nr:hypothetical protein CSC18_3893 [Klebsiella aerogenes]CCG31371.1 hypothetical protein [Klebsiella aerogenes EA1509E]